MDPKRRKQWVKPADSFTHCSKVAIDMSISSVSRFLVFQSGLQNPVGWARNHLAQFSEFKQKNKMLTPPEILAAEIWKLEEDPFPFKIAYFQGAFAVFMSG